MKKHQPEIVQFTNYPLIAVRNSYITIQWEVKNALFVYINNGIGLKKTKGIQLITLNKSVIYKIIAFGWFGKKVKHLSPITLRVNNKVPVPQLLKKEVKNTKTLDATNSKLKQVAGFKQINTINIKYKELKIYPDIEPLYSDLNQLMACETTKELENFRDLIINEQE
jgi:hypothetical protein